MNNLNKDILDSICKKCDPLSSLCFQSSCKYLYYLNLYIGKIDDNKLKNLLKNKTLFSDIFEKNRIQIYSKHYILIHYIENKNTDKFKEYIKSVNKIHPSVLEKSMLYNNIDAIKIILSNNNLYFTQFSHLWLIQLYKYENKECIKLLLSHEKFIDNDKLFRIILHTLMVNNKIDSFIYTIENSQKDITFRENFLLICSIQMKRKNFTNYLMTHKNVKLLYERQYKIRVYYTLFGKTYYTYNNIIPL